MNRDKLGLALAGGGFRASLFHLGVLRRMAELDLLRFVEVLSTVSGGSIVGALYVLILKREIEEKKGALQREDYEAIVDELDATMSASVQRDLRTRLLMDPRHLFLALVSEQSLSERMARLYERHLYREAVARLWEAEDRKGRKPDFRRRGEPGAFPMKDLLIRPATFENGENRDAYNARVVRALLGQAELRSSVRGGHSNAASTKLVVNATSLNSGARFWFSSSEIGDWFLGHVRYDETDHLSDCKRLLEDLKHEDIRELKGRYPSCNEDTLSVARWWLGKAESSQAPASTWKALFGPAFPVALCECDLGYLRQAKAAAYRASHHEAPDTAERAADMIDFWIAFRRIDEEHWLKLEPAREGRDPRSAEACLRFVTELYRLRTAEKIVPEVVKEHWDNLAIGDAVGASASCPPFFPPFRVWQFYDDRWVSTLGLTDGGVYDNLGVDALRDEGCTYIIASDSGRHLEREERSSTGRLGMLSRISSILQEDVGWHQGDLLKTQCAANGEVGLSVGGLRSIGARLAPLLRASGGGLADELCTEVRRLESCRQSGVWGCATINMTPRGGRPYVTPAFDRAVARIRTDLDAFGDVEFHILRDQGYRAADRALTADGDESAHVLGNYSLHARARDVRRHEPRAVSSRVMKAIKAGESRTFRALRLGSWLSWTITAILAGVLVGAVWFTYRRGLAGRLEAIGGTMEAHWPAAYSAWWLVVKAEVWVVVVALAAAFAMHLADFDLVRTLRNGDHAGVARRLASVDRWLRGHKWNLLWPVFLAPLVVPLVVSGAALISHFGYQKPFLRKTSPRSA